MSGANNAPLGGGGGGGLSARAASGGGGGSLLKPAYLQQGKIIRFTPLLSTVTTSRGVKRV